jgi:hypothetical protein
MRISKLTLFSIFFLFTSTLMSEESKGSIYLNCLNDDKTLRDAGMNETLVIDLDKKLFTSIQNFELDLTENNTYYFAQFENQFALQTYTLNRISLELNMKITQKKNGVVDSSDWGYNDYKCKMVERI